MTQPPSKRLLTEANAALLYVAIPAGGTEGQVLGLVSGKIAWVTPATASAPALASTGKPTITGTPQVGSQLTASTGSWSATPDSYTYQWFRGSTAVTSATAAGSTYTVVSADVGQALTVVVTAAKSGYTGATSQSAAVTGTAASAASDLALTASGSGVGSLSGSGLTILGGGLGSVSSTTLTSIGGGIGRIAA